MFLVLLMVKSSLVLFLVGDVTVVGSGVSLTGSSMVPCLAIFSCFFYVVFYSLTLLIPCI